MSLEVDIAIDNDDDLSGRPAHSRRANRAGDTRHKNKSRRANAHAIAELLEHDDKTGAVAMGAGSGFAPTFNASRHERRWIIDSLGGFHENHQIMDVVAQVKGGKEATVYCCSAGLAFGVDYLAAKVYRPRMFRNLSNDAAYREGSGPVDQQGKQLKRKRELRAVAGKTSFGLEVLHGSWLFNEYRTMTALYEAGALVPKPYAFGENAILMEYMGEPFAPAPTLDQVELPREEAKPLFDALIDSVRIMLANNRVHGDLSAFNVLYWEGEVRIIDFPQAVDPLFNPGAWQFFNRDVKRLCQYFYRYGIRPNANELAASLWSTQIPGDANDIQRELLARVEVGEMRR